MNPSGKSIGPLLFLVIVLVFLTAQACTSTPSPSPGSAASNTRPKPYKVMGKWYEPIPDARGFTQKGTASWYGVKFHGRKTASGEKYDMYGVSAAHKTLPLGTLVRVRNLDNGKEITVRINDRGPFVKQRVIDLSYGAAKALDFVGPGTTPVEISALGVEKSKGRVVAVDYYSGNFTFQVGAFSQRANAERLLAELDQRYLNAHIVPLHNGGETLYRVRVGRCTTLEQADEYENILIQHGFRDVFTIAE